jgi:hypothetical protein
MHEKLQTQRTPAIPPPNVKNVAYDILTNLSLKGMQNITQTAQFRLANNSNRSPNNPDMHNKNLGNLKFATVLRKRNSADIKIRMPGTYQIEGMPYEVTASHSDLFELL